jgi:heptosyltransferase-2
MQKVLIVGPAWVGDTVMAQCLLQLLKVRVGGCEIDVLAPAWTFSLLSRMPEVTTVIELPFAHGELKLAQRYKLAKTLQARKYDQAIVLPNSFKSALIPCLARIPKRTGWRGEYRYGLLNDLRVLNKQRYPLMIEQFMALGLEAHAVLPTPYPLPQLSVSTVSQQAALAKFKLSVQGRNVLALCAGAEFGPAKRWPAEYYADVANHHLQAGWDVWLLGSQKDRAVTDVIMQLTHGRCTNLAGLPVLPETIDLLSLAKGVVTNDSGLMHVATALNKPLIALYGPTSPAFTPPLGVKARILSRDLPCQPCFQRTCPLQHHACMREILPQEVIAHIAQWVN